MTNNHEAALELIHKVRSSHHMNQLKKAEWCMCFYCVQRFKFDEIDELCDKGETAICPRCNIDAVVYDLDRDTVVDLQDHYFNRGLKSDETEAKRFWDSPFVKGEGWKK